MGDWRARDPSGFRIRSTTVNDVWYSTDGVQWTQATDDAGFEPRVGHKSVVFDNKIWVIGGLQRTDGEDIHFNDVWYSENGIDWTMATDDIGTGFDILEFRLRCL
ncbi:MAG: hypothetical protein U5K72_08075 [Balneolaceae bacterium]|nr:hypothetical protein [Balneolaceae bacterium]